MEKENLTTEEAVAESKSDNPSPKKKSLKWLWITIALLVVAAIGVWCGINAETTYNAEKNTTTVNIFSLSALLVGIFGNSRL